MIWKLYHVPHLQQPVLACDLPVEMDEHKAQNLNLSLPGGWAFIKAKTEGEKIARWWRDQVVEQTHGLMVPGGDVQKVLADKIDAALTSKLAA